MFLKYLHPRRVPWLALAAALLVCTAILGSAQQLARRLILKDGSFQLISKYEVKGDRVRYLSAERNEWEEMPTSLVDWPATEKYEKDRTAGSSVPEAVQLDKEIDAEREAEEASQPQIAPGLRLPDDTGVFLLDTYKGEPQIIEVPQSEGDVNLNTKGNIFRGAINPVAGAKQTIELAGAHAAVQSHVGVPSIYIKVDPADERPAPPPSDRRSTGKDNHDARTANPQGPEQDADRGTHSRPQQPQQPQQAIIPFDRYRIIRADVKGGKRVLGDVKRGVTGKISEDQHIIKTTINNVKGGWLKITPTETLANGEYSVVEMMGKEGMNLYVWDFGVNPNAAANANPYKPEAKPVKPSEEKSKQPK
jgi:hypothetical protein